MDGTWTIHLFLDTVESPEPALLGSQTIFASVPMSTQAEDVHTISSIPLTSQLARLLGVEGLQHGDQSVVVDYLQQNLHWKVVAVRERLSHGTRTATANASHR
jgi:hypothetical protein